MKQTVQQISAKKVRRIASTKKAAKLPSKQWASISRAGLPNISKSNHTCIETDKWERQADNAAIQLSRGEIGVARTLTPTAAASRKLPSSRAESLPLNVREKLEEGFNADLSAVRIHKDKAANDVSQSENARAFAAGSNIYFSAGEFQPKSEAGFNLLAHEIAHVLQQTGRPSHDNSMRATNVVGQGEIQKREHYFIENPTPTVVSLAQPELEQLVQLYQLLVPSTESAQMEHTIDEVRIFYSEDASGLSLADWVENEHGVDDTSLFGQHCRAFVADCLKKLGHFEAAAYLYASDPLLPTTVHSSEAFEAATQRIGSDWVFSQLRREPLRFYYPNQFTDTYRRYLLGPTRDLPAMSVNDRLGASGEMYELGDYQVFSRLALDNAATDLLHKNELYYSAIYNLKFADLQRQSILADIIADVNSDFHEPDAITIRFKVASRLAELFVQVQEMFDSEGEAGVDSISRLFIPVMGPILEVAQNAAEVWQRVIEINNSVVNASRITEETVDVLTELAAREELNPIRERLLRDGQRLFALRSEARLPTAGQYSRRVNTIKLDFSAFRLNFFELPLIALSRSEEGFDTDLAVAYGTLWGLMQSYFDVLDSYVYRDDSRFINGLADVRIGNRIRMARWYHDFGRTVGWQELVDIATPVLTASQEGVTENQVALLGDWQLDTTRSVEAIASDDTGGFSGALEDLNSITASHIALIFRIQYYEAISSGIEGILDTEMGDVSEASRGRESVISRVMTIANQLSMPKRYFIAAENYEIAGQDPPTTEASTGTTEGEANTPRSDIYVLIEEHPKTQQVLRTENVPDADTVDFSQPFGIWPDRKPRSGREIYFWIIPSFQPLVERLQQIPELNILVEAQLGQAETEGTGEQSGSMEFSGMEITVTAPAAGTEAEVEESAEESRREETTGAEAAEPESQPAWLTWFMAFLEVDINDPSLAGIYSTAEFSTRLHGEQTTAYETAMSEIRRAFAHERNRFVELTLRPMLMHFEPYDRDTVTLEDAFGDEHNFVIRDLAEEVFTALTAFIRQLPNRQEQDAHFAMAMVELSATLQEKLSDPDMLGLHMEIVRRYAPLISAAIDLIDGVSDADLEEQPPSLDLFLTGNETAATISAGRQRLDDLLTVMITAIEQHQEEWGIEAVRGDSTHENPGFIREIDSSRELGPTEPFTIDGVTWQVMQVVRPFRYHPSAGSQFRREESRRVGSSILFVDGQRMSNEERAADEASNTVLLYVRINESTIPTAITASSEDVNERLLEQLAWSASRYDTVAQMRELGEVLEAGAGYLMDLAELFPGVGPAVAATRLLQAVTTFISGDLPTVLSALIEDPRQLFEQIQEQLSDVLDPSSLLEYFLFGSVAFEGIRRRRTQATRVRTGSRRAQRIFSKLRLLGAGVAAIFSRMQGQVRDARHAAQLSVIQHPLLVRVVNVIATYYHLLAEIPNMAQELSDFSSHSQRLAEGISHTVNAMGEVELPEQLVPMEDIVGLVIDIVGHRLGGKYKAGVRVLLALLELIGARQELEEAIADGIHALGVDTDDIIPIWQDELVPFIETKLHEAQLALRNELNRVFEAVPGLDLALEEPTVNRQFTGSEFPETQPYLNTSTTPGLLSSPDFSAGQPLSAGMRGNLEQCFGQDFGHVRLHTNTKARHLNYQAGSRALTTGSHVFLDGSPSSTNQHVLYHELAHVVQQTGNRPLGKMYSHQPQTGKPGRGLNINSSAEQSADRAVAQAKKGRVQEPLSRDGRNASGWQPTMLEDLGERFLRYLVNFESIESEVERIDRTTTGTGARLIGRDVKNTVDNVASSLNTICRQHLPNKFRIHHTMNDTLSSKREQIASHIVNQRIPIQNAIDDLAIQASYTIRRATGSTPPQMGLRVHKFKDKLVRYIFGRTGVLLDIELNTTGRGRRARLNGRTPINKVTIMFLHLPPISSNSNLWIDALTHRSNATGGPGQAIPPNERGAVRTRARQVLRSMGPSSQAWANNGYRLSHAVYQDIDELARLEQEAGTAGELAAEDLPTKTDYLAETGSRLTSSSGADLGNVGLRLGTYSERLDADGRRRGPRGPQWAKERESHHITQYLLVEYFHNGKAGEQETDPDRMGFPLYRQHNDAYPEIVDGADNKPGGFRGIDIETLEAGRGGEMPAISLARPTHRRGRLHVSPYADDFKGSTDIRTQAGAVNHKFVNYLTPTYHEKESAALENAAGYGQWETWRDSNSTVVADTISTAMQKTYKWMRKYMQDRLKEGLRVNEREYYNDLGESVTRTNASNYQISTSEMDTVHGNAVRRNNTVMSRFGWTGQS